MMNDKAKTRLIEELRTMRDEEMTNLRHTVLIITHTDDVSDDYIVQTLGDLPGVVNIDQKGRTP